MCNFFALTRFKKMLMLELKLLNKLTKSLVTDV
jgi:hypothetical protein